jgi:nucleoside-diphosphate-sugar epimerase
VRGSFGDGFDRYVRHNIVATQRLLEASVRATSQPAFVYASSSSVYGDAEGFPTDEERRRQPRSPYGLTKLATEELTELYRRGSGVRTIGLRYFTVYGPRQRPDMAFARFIAAGIAGDPIEVLGDGSQIRDFTFVDDAVEGTLAAARSGTAGAVYNIGGGSQVHLLDAIELIAALIDRPIAIEHRPAARGDVRRTCSDPRRAARDLHFLPTTTLHDGLEKQIGWTLERVDAGHAVATA